jgi:2-oxoglutarate dehydrogenase complex dehydrogenase (E1) component-like enzyme
MSLNKEKERLKNEVKEYLDKLFINEKGEIIIEELNEKQKEDLKDILTKLRKNDESTVIFCSTIINYDINTRLRKNNIEINDDILSIQQEIYNIALEIDKSID